MLGISSPKISINIGLEKVQMNDHFILCLFLISTKNFILDLS